MVESPRVKVERELQELGWPSDWTFEIVIQLWDSITEQVEVGYAGTIDDYTNDMAAREWIRCASELLDESDVQEISTLLKPIDERFIFSTLETSELLISSADQWWYRRLPKKLVGELMLDVDHLQAKPD